MDGDLERKDVTFVKIRWEMPWCPRIRYVGAEQIKIKSEHQVHMYLYQSSNGTWWNRRRIPSLALLSIMKRIKQLSELKH